jgi:DNA-binding Lrp family transcriptional regulator
MLTSIILMNVKRDQVSQIAEQLADMPEVSEAYSVSGKYDVIAMVRVKTNDELAELVTDRLAKIKGIEKTDTTLAFKAYSKYDLEAMFAV